MENNPDLLEMIIEDIVLGEGPMLVKGGPGSGKTTVLARKLKYLVEKKKGVKARPNQITVITYTNEAANNMRKAISNEQEKETYIRPELQPRRICTMHKLAHGMVRENTAILGLPSGLRVLSSDDLREILMADCSQMVGAPRKSAKQALLCRQRGKCLEDDSLKCRICDKYTGLLAKLGYIDHDHQILLGCKLLRENKSVLVKEQSKAKYLLVDEYQDINYAQWELIKLLSQNRTQSLFVVGDEYQSIYRFRGGSPEYIRAFQDDYEPDAEVRHLMVCHRCPPKIYKGALSMVQEYNWGAPELIDNTELTRKSDALIRICRFERDNHEAAFIATEVKKMGPSFDVLILVPTFPFTAPIRRALRNRFIDFSCGYRIGETDLSTLRVLLDWLKNPEDNFKFRILLDKLINAGASDIPSKHVESKGREESKRKREDALRRISELWPQIGARKTLYLKTKTLSDKPPFEELVNVLTELRRSYKNGIDIAEFLALVTDKLKLWRKIPNLHSELSSVIQEVSRTVDAGPTTPVRVLTMRKAKGLQADYVFLVGLENGVLPQREISKAEKQEQSRLLYVSMTRARKGLYLCYCDARDRGITRVRIGKRSEFLNAIPDPYVMEEDHRRTSTRKD